MDENSGWFQIEEAKTLKRKQPLKKTAANLAKIQKGLCQEHRKTSISHENCVNQADIKKTGEVLSEQSDTYDVRAQPVTQNPVITERAPTQSSTKKRDLSKWSNDSPTEHHAQTVGKGGPVLEQDSVTHELLEDLIHEKIIERPVHAKGFGAFGYFEVINSMSTYTKLQFLQTPGQQVPVAVRFSLAASVKGTPDTSRNVRGFSTKFYTNEGIFDLICNHLPVISIRDPIRFSESVKATSPSPTNNLVDPNRFWSFVARAPESISFVVRFYSDAGTVKSFRHIRGYSVNTYVWRNIQGVRYYLKYHWVPFAGEEWIDREEATRLAGTDPDVAGKDLYDTIAAGKSVEYGLYVQLMNPVDAESLTYDPLDATKVWDEREYPLLPVGKMVLNQNPDNYMEQVEKISFSPSNLLEGAELSDDKILQGRANIYSDSQRRRIGPEFRKVPVNQQQNWTPADLQTSGEGLYVEGRLVRSDIEKQDDFTQAGTYYEQLSPVQQEHLVNNLSTDLKIVDQDIQRIVLNYLSQASEELADRVTRKIAESTSRYFKE
ncbi:catalase [Bacillus cereus]